MLLFLSISRLSILSSCPSICHLRAQVIVNIPKTTVGLFPLSSSPRLELLAARGSPGGRAASGVPQPRGRPRRAAALALQRQHHTRLLALRCPLRQG